MEAWTECAGEWKRSQLYIRIKKASKESEHGARVWLTRGQIKKKYRSEQIANQICDSKLHDPKMFETQTKEHPDLPEREARQSIGDVTTYACYICVCFFICLMRYGVGHVVSKLNLIELFFVIIQLQKNNTIFSNCLFNI